MYEYDNLVVGAGISGATIAYLLANELHESVLLVDAKDHIAGNCYDYRDENGIMIHKYGSHVLHTNNVNVWKFLNKFSSFNTYMHKVIALVDGIETTIPFNINTLYDVFPKTLAVRLEEKLLKNYAYNDKIPILDFQKSNDDDLKFLASYIYRRIFLDYTVKQWGVKPEEIDESVTARVPVYISRDNRYFQDTYQGVPTIGFTGIIWKMISHPSIKLKLSKTHAEIKESQNFFKRVFYTGSIDEYFNYKFGILPYRSVSFKFETHNCEFYQSNSVINYPTNYDFTRIHEYKYYLNDKSSKTVIAKEYSEPFKIKKNERCYPIINEDNIELYSKYRNEMNERNVFFFGRLGDYKYYNIDEAIERALKLFEQIKGDMI